MYALVQDAKCKHRGWQIRDGILRLCKGKDLWLPPGTKYHLNTVGHVHVCKGFQTSQVRQNPDMPTEWMSLVSIGPTRVEEVCLCDIPSGAIQYVERLTSGKQTRRHKHIATRKIE